MDVVPTSIIARMRKRVRFDVPAHIPCLSGVVRAWVRHSAKTGQLLQYSLTSLILVIVRDVREESPVSPKKVSFAFSMDRHLAISYQEGMRSDQETLRWVTSGST